VAVVGLGEMLTAVAWAARTGALLGLVCMQRAERWARWAWHAGPRLAVASGLGEMLIATAWAVWTWGLLLVLHGTGGAMDPALWTMGPSGTACWTVAHAAVVALGEMLTATAWAARTWAVFDLRLVLFHMRQAEQWARCILACIAHPSGESADLRLGTSMIL
jgi:hypothetical protein